MSAPGCLPVGICVAILATVATSTPTAAFPLASLVPDLEPGVTITTTAPPVIGISNAIESLGADFIDSATNRVVAGIFIARTANDSPYNHNRKTCRLVGDGAVLTAILGTKIGDGYFYDVVTREGTVVEHASHFVLRRIDSDTWRLDSRYLGEEYPPIPEALETISIQTWSTDVRRLRALTMGVLKKVGLLGSVELANTVPMPLPAVTILRASHFADQLYLTVENQTENMADAMLEGTLVRRPHSAPERFQFARVITPGRQTLSLNVGPMSGIVAYSVDQVGFRDQAYVGRGFGYFGDDHAGGHTSITFDDRSCGYPNAQVTSGVVLLPGCARITGTVDKWAGMFLPVGSYVGETFDLPRLGYVAIEFLARSQGSFRFQVEDLAVRDFDYHGVDLTGDGLWQEYRVPFSALSQRGFGAPTTFGGNVVQLSWLVDPVDGAFLPFDIDVETVRIFAGTTTTTTSVPTTSTTLPSACPLDIDGDGAPTVAADVVYIARHLFGLAPVPPSFRRANPTIADDLTIAARVDAIHERLDVDGDGDVAVATDIIYIARYVFGLTPVPPSFRTAAAIPADAVIVAAIDALCPTGNRDIR